MILGKNIGSCKKYLIRMLSINENEPYGVFLKAQVDEFTITIDNILDAKIQVKMKNLR